MLGEPPESATCPRRSRKKLRSPGGAVAWLPRFVVGSLWLTIRPRLLNPARGAGRPAIGMQLRLVALAVLSLTVPPLTAGLTLADGIVTTDNETPVLYDDDEGGNASGDDPAIWVHPGNPSRSIIIVTAKEGGLRVYDLDSREIQFIAAEPAPRSDGVNGRYNNVDIAYDVTVVSEAADVAVVSDRYNDQLRFFAIDPAGADAPTPLHEVTAPEQTFLFNPDRAAVDEERSAYGVAVWQPDENSTYAVITQEGTTRIATARIVSTPAGIGYTDIRHMEMPGSFPLPNGEVWVPCEEPGVLPQLEGVAVDQRTGVLYATQEDVGLWRISLPLGSAQPKLLDKVADFGVHAVFNSESEECEPVDENAPSFGGSNLVADAEGVDIYYGPGATGYIIVSSQGNDQYAVYSTTGNNRSLGTFRVVGVGVDDVNGSDGLAVTNRPVGKYSDGLLVSHDEPESGVGVDPDRDPTNFSYVSWGSVAKALNLKVDTTAHNDPRFGGPAR
jgi:3-phytase